MEVVYKGFVVKIMYSADVDSFYGEIVDQNFLNVFQAKTLEGCKEAMRYAIDEYVIVQGQ